jgi:hypothetical protein
LLDLEDKKVVEQGEVSGAKGFDLGDPDRDYFVLITPSEGK